MPYGWRACKQHSISESCRNMIVLLFLAKGFETMEAGDFIDVFDRTKISYGYDIEMYYSF